MAWKRYRRVSIAMSIIVAAVVACLGTAAAANLGDVGYVRSQLDRFGARPRRSPADVEPGPAVYAGALTTERMTVAPTGESCAAWVAWVRATTGSGKSSRSWTACSDGAVGDLLLEGDGAFVRVAFGSAPGRLHVAQRDGASRAWQRLPAFDAAAVSRSGDTNQMVGWCSLPGGARYELRVACIPRGARVEVSGCGRTGADGGREIVPCYDGYDFVTARSSRDVMADRASHELVGLRALVALLGGVLAIVGGVACKWHVRLARGAGEG